jgi:hypothetical protein
MASKHFTSPKDVSARFRSVLAEMLQRVRLSRLNLKPPLPVAFFVGAVADREMPMVTLLSGVVAEMK